MKDSTTKEKPKDDISGLIIPPVAFFFCLFCFRISLH